MGKTSLSVARYLINRLSALGIDQVFGVPGDYAFPIDDAIEDNPDVHWVVCANELNAAYAADGYARVRGAAIMTTTYGVGELCTLGALMGARAHRLPVFHLVGMPSLRIQRQHRVTHHSLGDGVYGNFIPIAASVACVHTQLTADNAVDEIERVIREALRQSAPAYILLPEDQAHLPLLGTPIDGKPLCQIKRQLSAPAELEAAVAALADAVNQSRRPVVMPTALLQRYGVAKEAEELLRKTGLPFATTPMDKAVVSEALQGFLGVYLGMASAASAKAARGCGCGS